MKVYLVEVEHYDKYIAGPVCAFTDEQDATRFAEEWDSAHAEGYAAVCEYDLYDDFEAAMKDGHGEYFAEMREV